MSKIGKLQKMISLDIFAEEKSSSNDFKNLLLADSAVTLRHVVYRESI